MTDNVSHRQQRLAALLKQTDGMITAGDASRILEVDKPYARTLLANWHKQGVLRRVGHGLYVPVSPADLGQKQVLENPWVLVPKLFWPGYVGGWSAAEHWELTEQVFRSTCVLTSKRTAPGDREIQGVMFSIYNCPEKSIYGTKTIWQKNIKIQISDPHKTIVDILNNPVLGAGLQHTVDCFREYAKLYEGQESRLIEYADKLGNGVLFKKLGYLGEISGFDESFLQQCKERLTSGFSPIDSQLKSHRKLVTRWKLWIPETWKSE
jgi:predicted transcriptional regulator of viral defense system